MEYHYILISCFASCLSAVLCTIYLWEKIYNKLPNMPKKPSAFKINRTKEKLLRLQTSERVNHVQSVGNNSSGFWVILGTKKYRFHGLKPTIGKIFFPWVNEDPRFGNKNRQPVLTKHVPHNQKSICPTHGVEHGENVHSQIEKYFKMVYQEKKKESEFLELDGLDPCTVKIIATLKLKKWVPVASEYPVYDEDLKLATKIDMIVYDSEASELLLIELKTGYEEEEYRELATDREYTGIQMIGGKRISVPLEEVKDCPENRHYMQALVSAIILQKRNSVKCDKVYVLRCLPKAQVVEVLEKPPKWTKKKKVKDLIYETLLICQKEEEQEKKMEKERKKEEAKHQELFQQ